MKKNELKILQLKKVDLGLKHRSSASKFHVVSSDTIANPHIHTDTYTCFFACLFSFLITLPLYSLDLMVHQRSALFPCLHIFYSAHLANL